MAARGRGRGERGFRGGPRGGGPAVRGSGIFTPPGSSTQFDSRLSDGSETVLIQSFRTLRLSSSNDLPLRPGFGTAGTSVTLRANFFPVKVPKGPLYEYDVAISPAVSLRRIKRRIFQLAEQSQEWTQHRLRGIVAHDHSAKLIAARSLPQPLTIPIQYSDEDESGPQRNYTLTINFTQTLDTSNLVSYLEGEPGYRGYDILPVISALNIVLAAYPNRTAGILVGRNRYFFPSAAPPSPLGGGLEAWRGFYSSVRPTHKQLMVNVNACTTAFYTPGNLADSMLAYRNHSHGARYSAFANKVRVKTTHLGHKKTVSAVSDKTPQSHKFRCEEFNNAEVSVETYFKRKYNITLRHRDLPLVDLGNARRSILVPPEVCIILENQPFRGKLSDENTSAMITFAANPPSTNATAITGRGLDLLGFRQPVEPLQGFGISIGSQMAVVPGRILPAPGLRYGQGSVHIDDRASWNLKNVRFAKGAHLQNWVVLVIKDGNPRDEFNGPNDPGLRETIADFVRTMRNCGMVVSGEPTYIPAELPPRDIRDSTRSKAIAAIRAALQTVRSKPSFILTLLSNADKHVYNGLKHLCDSYLDVATVCVHSSKLRKRQVQYFANVALKINVKLGGINHALDAASMRWLLQMRTMVVGIDVTHPGPGTVPGTPSIAAVVASVDQQFAQYPASMEIQESKKEMVTNLATMMVQRLSLYRERNNNQLPQRILVYRDGVSEGQFSIVIADELPLIREACRKFDSPQSKYRPKVTIIICGKRHHTRFYPTDTAGADQKGNPKAGTVVDRGVTAVYDFDFFLQAHGGLQGTTRPSHYYVVHDEIGFQADEVQKLTNDLSYMFSRATKAVSLVSPAYYADLCCERGRCFLHKLLSGVTAVNLKATDASEKVMEEAKSLWHDGVRQTQLKDTMYYI